MHLTLLESDRRFIQTAECAVLSIVAHSALVWGAVALTTGGRVLPQTPREAMTGATAQRAPKAGSYAVRRPDGGGVKTRAAPGDSFP